MLKNLVSSFTKLLPGKAVKEKECVVPSPGTEILSSGLLVCLYAYKFMKTEVFCLAQQQQIRTLVLDKIRRHCSLVFGIERSGICMACKAPLHRNSGNVVEKVVSCCVCGARRHKICVGSPFGDNLVFRCGDDVL